MYAKYHCLWFAELLVEKFKASQRFKERQPNARCGRSKSMRYWILTKKKKVDASTIEIKSTLQNKLFQKTASLNQFHQLQIGQNLLM